jgi:hypothetical protein
VRGGIQAQLNRRTSLKEVVVRRRWASRAFWEAWLVHRAAVCLSPFDPHPSPADIYESVKCFLSEPNAGPPSYSFTSLSSASIGWKSSN